MMKKPRKYDHNKLASNQYYKATACKRTFYPDKSVLGFEFLGALDIVIDQTKPSKVGSEFENKYGIWVLHLVHPR